MNRFRKLYFSCNMLFAAASPLFLAAGNCFDFGNDPVQKTACQKITDKEQCQKDDTCLFRNNACEDAKSRESGTCAAIKVEAICNEHKGSKEAKHCVWIASEDRCAVGPRKNVQVYELTKIARADYGIASNDLAGLTASEEGKYIYAVGATNATLKSLSVAAPGAWDDAVGDWNGSMKKAANRGPEADHRQEKVLRFAPTSNGLLFQLSSDKGIVILEGTGGVNTSVYPQDVWGGGLKARIYVPLFAQSKIDAGADHPLASYIYLSDPVTPEVLFRQVDFPLLNDNPMGAGIQGRKNGRWNNLLKKATGAPLNNDDRFTALSQSASGDIYLGARTRVAKLSESKVGTTGAAQRLDNGDVTVQAEWALVPGTANDQGIAALAVLGDYLIIGLKAGAAPALDPNKGGVVIKNIATGDAPTVYGAGQTMTVNWIGVDSKNPNPKDAFAIIGTDKGMLLFKSGALIKPIPGKDELINEALIAAHRAKLEYRSPEDGFAGANLASTATNCVGAGFAEGSGNTWYVAFKGTGADDGGIFKFTITSTVLDP